MSCKLTQCDPFNDLLAYNLQNGEAENHSAVIPEPVNCRSFTCTGSMALNENGWTEEIVKYNLQSNVFFNSDFLIGVVDCPPGYTCNPGTVVNPPGVIVNPPLPPQPPDPQDPWDITFPGCVNDIRLLVTNTRAATVTVPGAYSIKLFNLTVGGAGGEVYSATATDDNYLAQIEAAMAAMNQMIANQQATCGSINPPNPPIYPPGNPYIPPSQPPTRNYLNDPVYFYLDCDEPLVPTYRGNLPSWITLDQAGGRLVGAAGVFTGTTRGLANESAQNAINQFGNAAVQSGALACRGQYQNETQCVGCGVGVELTGYSSMMDENGIIAINGQFCAAAGYYFSTISVADANAQALAAAQAALEAASQAGNIVCALIEWGDLEASITTVGYTATGDGSGSSANITLHGNGCASDPSEPAGPEGAKVSPNTLGAIEYKLCAVLPKNLEGRTLRCKLKVEGEIDCTRRPVYTHQTNTVAFLNASSVGGISYSEGPTPGTDTPYDLSGYADVVVPATAASIETSVTSGGGGVVKGQTGVTFDVASAAGFSVGNTITVNGAGLLTITGISGNQITATYMNNCVNGIRSIAVGATVTRRTSYNTISLVHKTQNFGGDVTGRLQLSVVS